MGQGGQWGMKSNQQGAAWPFLIILTGLFALSVGSGRGVGGSGVLVGTVPCDVGVAHTMGSV